jgi:hypothetical protein
MRSRDNQVPAVCSSDCLLRQQPIDARASKGSILGGKGDKDSRLRTDEQEGANGKANQLAKSQTFWATDFGPPLRV